jgi:hypothetical protein
MSSGTEIVGRMMKLWFSELPLATAFTFTSSVLFESGAGVYLKSPAGLISQPAGAFSMENAGDENWFDLSWSCNAFGAAGTK